MRELFPDALIAVVGVHDDRGGWNADLAEYAEHFDAVTMHPYEPPKCRAQEWGGGDHEKSAVAAWGEGSIRKLRAHARSTMGDLILNKQIWLTEFNVGGGSGCGGAPDVITAGGAMLGLFWAGYVLAAIDMYDSDTPVRGLMYHLFDWQEGCDAGPDHKACWGKDSQLVTLPRRGFHDSRAAKVGGAGQIFAHVSAVALRGEASRMRRVPLSSNQCGNILPVSPDHQGELGCLVAAAFDSPTAAGVSFVVLNRCVHEVSTTFEAADLLRLPPGALSWQLTTTVYSADDAGGFVPLPADTSVLPWSEGPLSPTVVESELSPDELSVPITLERLSLTIATFSALVRYPVSPPSPPSPPPPYPRPPWPLPEMPPPPHSPTALHFHRVSSAGTAECSRCLSGVVRGEAPSASASAATGAAAAAATAAAPPPRGRLPGRPACRLKRPHARAVRVPSPSAARGANCHANPKSMIFSAPSAW